VGETRWQIWQSLMVGAKGVIFFVLFPEPNDRAPNAPGGERTDIPADWPRVTQTLSTGAGSGMLTPHGAPTPQMLAVAETFASLEPHRELLWRCTPTAPIAWARPPLRTATLRDPQDGSLLVVIVNDDTDRQQQGFLQLLAPAAQVYDLLAGKPLATRERATTGEREVILSLPPGGGALLRIEPAVATRVATIYHEGASVQSTPAQPHEVRRNWQPHQWGMGHRAGWQPMRETGWLQYEIVQVAAQWREGGERLYLHYYGNGVEVWGSSDGSQFSVLARAGSGAPVRLPDDLTHVRLVLTKPDSVLWEWQLIRVAQAP